MQTSFAFGYWTGFAQFRPYGRCRTCFCRCTEANWMFHRLRRLSRWDFWHYFKNHVQCSVSNSCPCNICNKAYEEAVGKVYCLFRRLCFWLGISCVLDAENYSILILSREFFYHFNIGCDKIWNQELYSCLNHNGKRHIHNHQKERRPEEKKILWTSLFLFFTSVDGQMHSSRFSAYRWRSSAQWIFCPRSRMVSWTYSGREQKNWLAFWSCWRSLFKSHVFWFIIDHLKASS